jgi:hypothetical protein
MPGYQSTLVEMQVDGPACTGTGETSMLGPGTTASSHTKIVLPSGYLNRVGKRLLVRATGRVSNIVTTPGNLTLRFKLGPTANIAVATSTAIPLNIVAKTNVSWFLDLGLTVRTIGPGTIATIFHQGNWTSESVIGSPTAATGGQGAMMWQTATPVVGTGFDSGVANQIDLTAQFSLTGNSITMHTFALEDLTTTP